MRYASARAPQRAWPSLPTAKHSIASFARCWGESERAGVKSHEPCATPVYATTTMPTQKPAKNNRNNTSVQLRSLSISCQSQTPVLSQVAEVHAPQVTPCLSRVHSSETRQHQVCLSQQVWGPCIASRPATSAREHSLHTLHTSATPRITHHRGAKRFNPRRICEYSALPFSPAAYPAHVPQ